jgi:alkylhydroperoxidase family enzyme
VLGKEVTAAVLADHRTAPIPETVRAVLDYLEVMTRRPEEVGGAALAAVRAAGVSDAAIVDAAHVAMLFNIITRMADALEFAMPDDDFASSAASLLSRGYKL